jgi:hypothetical protein
VAKTPLLLGEMQHTGDKFEPLIEFDNVVVETYRQKSVYLRWKAKKLIEFRIFDETVTRNVCPGSQFPGRISDGQAITLIVNPKIEPTLYERFASEVRG